MTNTDPESLENSKKFNNITRKGHGNGKREVKILRTRKLNPGQPVEDSSGHIYVKVKGGIRRVTHKEHELRHQGSLSFVQRHAMQQGMEQAGYNPTPVANDA